MNKQYMEEVWGSKCPDYEPTCFLCRAWVIYEVTGNIPDSEQVVRKIHETEGCDFLQSPTFKKLRDCAHRKPQ
jgi:hypothetical protein